MNHALLSPATRRRLSVAVVGLALLAGSATPAQADHHTPEPALLPFAATSPWRLGIAEAATFAPPSDARNVAIADVDASGAAWVNSGRYSHPVARATGTTPFASMTDSFHSLKGVPQGGTWQEQIPAEARIADGTDRHMHVITADGQHVQEHFGTTRVSPTEYTTKRRHQVSLTGSGIGPQNGTRAYGGSAIGGLIRAWEVDPTHPQYTGSIEHPLAVALRADQLYYAGVTLAQDGYGATYNRYGYGLAQGYVWPATEQDSDSRWSYSGVIPMGSYFAIPPEVDIASLGLQTPEARMLAEAAQDYGVYVTDRSGSSAFYVEDDGGAATAAFAKALIGPSYTATEVKRVFKALRVVEGNSASAPNGGPLGVERRGDLDDPAPATGEVLLPGYTEPTTTTTPTPAPSPTTTATTTTAPTTGYAAKVRFQTATATPPAGYLADWGQPYGTRTGSTQGTGLAYGWVQAATGAPVDLTKNGRVRTGTTTTDQRLTGIMHMDWQTTAGTSGTAIPGAWELAVPNGTYTVTVAVGDAGNHYDSLHHLNIEGVTAVSAFTGTSANRFATATRTVAVTDGRLTLTQTGGRNTKLAYVDVAEAFSTKMRFQTATATPPAGYLADWGQPYGTRTGSTQGTGLAYGWVQAATGAPVDLTKNGRVRTGTTTTDQRLTGIMHMDWQTTAGTSGTAIPGAWELAVPNGTYTVTVAVGDAGNHYDSLHHLNIEGVTAVSAFTGTSANRFATATRTVAVTDGRLTLTQTGGRNTKLAYVDVATALGA